MKIILLDNIASLGRKGDVKHVSDGYAMNYLLPQGKAMPATAQNINEHLDKEKNEDIKLKEQINLYNKIKNSLNEKTIVFSANSSAKGILYQGISIRTIMGAVREKYDIELNGSWFSTTAVLKKLGKHKINLNLPNGEKVLLYIKIKSL